ncbi:hypothetical protein B9Y76_18795 [Stenotrophomonas maltophilia]|uniref:hypothetical protein n=1 Tax=Stenotrophomonas maltophilia TaxID=40324 RepID=UPI000C261A58|nr:hypothetical protein [Stenotrophomonas maltophilia]PJK97097.1 hypothetical protein B9Y76_18795 [Stenotrophomonas maltophilia]
MSNDKTTLADVQPGGRVRLGDQALSTSEGARRYVADYFATQLSRHDFGDYILTDLAADFACALAQHLSAQPSPGGQDALTEQQIYDRFGFLEGLVTEATYRRIANEASSIQQMALAARQPVGEPVAFDYPKFNAVGMCCVLEDRGVHFLIDAAQYGFDEALDQMKAILKSIGPLYAAPPAQAVSQDWQHIANEWADAATNGVQWLRNIRDGASTVADALACMESNVERIQQLKPPAQAVDLGQFRPAVCAMGLYAEEPEDVDEAKRLLALIDSQAVGK